MKMYLGKNIEESRSGNPYLNFLEQLIYLNLFICVNPFFLVFVLIFLFKFFFRKELCICKSSGYFIISIL